MKFKFDPGNTQLLAVTPYVGVWIEMWCYGILKKGEYVTPYVGVWIEMMKWIKYMSILFVTPYVGVWIEIAEYFQLLQNGLVTPYVGVWIEINVSSGFIHSFLSLPTWECGLKSRCVPDGQH